MRHETCSDFFQTICYNFACPLQSTREPAAGEPLIPKKWQAEADKLAAQKDLQYQQRKAIWEDIKAVESLRKAAEQLAKEQPNQSRKKGNHELWA